MSRIPGKIVVKEFAFINDYSTLLILGGNIV